MPRVAHRSSVLEPRPDRQIMSLGDDLPSPEGGACPMSADGQLGPAVPKTGRHGTQDRGPSPSTRVTRMGSAPRVADVDQVFAVPVVLSHDQPVAVGANGDAHRPSPNDRERYCLPPGLLPSDRWPHRSCRARSTPSSPANPVRSATPPVFRHRHLLARYVGTEPRAAPGPAATLLKPDPRQIGAIPRLRASTGLSACRKCKSRRAAASVPPVLC